MGFNSGFKGLKTAQSSSPDPLQLLLRRQASGAVPQGLEQNNTSGINKYA